MITSYDAFSVEVPIRKQDSKQLIDTFQSLSAKYPGIVKETLHSIPGGKETLKENNDRVSDWLQGSRNQELVFEMFSWKGIGRAFAVAELRSIKNLQTSFGRKNRKKCVAYLLLYLFSDKQNLSKETADFQIELRRSLKKHFKLRALPRLNSVSTINDQFESFWKKHKTKTKDSPITYAVVKLLKDQDFRNVVLRTRQAKDPTLENIAKSAGLDINRTRHIIQRAISQNVLSRQYNVKCKECDKTLARVSRRESISQMAKGRVSCPTCKRSVSTGSYETAYSTNPRIDSLLDGSKWMHIYVKQTLQQFGIKRILSEIKDGPNELDLVGNMEGSLLLLELKDNRFSIGHAYSFVGKCSQYKPTISFIIATQGIDNDVKDYIKKTGVRTNYIENLGELDKRFGEVFSEHFARILRQLLTAVAWSRLLSGAVLQKFGHKMPIPEQELLLEDEF